MDTNSYLLIGLGILFLYSILSRQSGNQDVHLARLERKIDAILKELGLEINAGINAEVLALAKAGKKIEAIKLYREQTGVSLKEAKDYVESL